MKELDVFIHGETMNLCIPTEEFARESEWYSWFNKPGVTRFLEQGMFPNTPEDQVAFFNSQKKDRIMTIISNKKKYIGIISLSNIKLVKQTCEVAIVVDTSLDRKMAPYISLEAMARISEHAFSMGINRIEAGQHIKLKGWQQRMELLGYKLEGLHKKKFTKGHEVADSVTLACHFEDFQNIISHRGALWDSKDKMESRCRQLPRESFSDMINNFFENERNNYYSKIFSLDHK